MILFQPIVEIRVGPVQDITAQDLADRTRIGVVSIRRNALWSVTNRLEGLLEKALGGIQISLLAGAASQPGCHPDQWPDTDSPISLAP